MNSINMEFKHVSVFVYICIGISYLKLGSCTITCNIKPENPIIGEMIVFNCMTIGPTSAETKLVTRWPTQYKPFPLTKEDGKNGEFVSYIWIATPDDIEFEVKCKEKMDKNITSTCAKTIPMPIAISEPTSLSTMEKTTVSETTVFTKNTLHSNIGNDTDETQLLRPTLSIPITKTMIEDILTPNESINTDYFTTVTYEGDYSDDVNENEYNDTGFFLFELYPTIFWGLVVGLIIIFFVVIIATMCLFFLTQSKRRKERKHSNVPYTGSMEILTGPFRRPAGAYLDLNESQAATPNTVDRACQTMPCNLPWLAIDVDDDNHGYDINGDIGRSTSVSGRGNFEFEPNVLGPRGASYIQTKHGLARSESDRARRYSAVCRTRTGLDPQFYIPQQRGYRHSDHEMYHLQKYNNQLYDAQPIATEFEPVRRYKRRANQIAGTHQSRPYSYIDPSIAQLVPPSASGKPKAGNRDEYSDSTL